MKFEADNLLADLTKRTKGIINDAESFQGLPIEQLNWKNVADSWSILECFEHLNRYSQFYIPEIQSKIVQKKHLRKNAYFKSGWLGNYFAKSMLPKEQLNKMNTFKSMNPSGSSLDKGTLVQFLEDQQQMLNLFNKSKALDLQKTKTAISISSWIKLRLGDTFRVVVYHNQRHVVQAQKVLSLQK